MAADGDKATEKLKLGSQNSEAVVIRPRFVNLLVLSNHAGTECLQQCCLGSVTESRAVL